MAPKKWARVMPAGAHGMRRGAWYPVVGQRNGGIVILAIDKKNVPMDRTMLVFRDSPPDRWSVVHMDSSTTAGRASAEHFGPSYGVCPSCAARQILTEGMETAVCEECEGEFRVDWVERC